jgi:mono/diheme cytochrome c family protein
MVTVRVLRTCLAAISMAIGTCAVMAAGTSTDVVARGKYLTAAGDCMACHTQQGGAAFAGGRYIDTPFGSIASPNITPDKATGIGNWSDAQFYRAMHDGIGHRGEYLYPVMPFPWYSSVTPQDVAAIRAYLQTVKPVSKARAPNHLHFPFNVREALLAWRVAFFKAATFEPNPAHSAEVNRGDYLVNGLAHCGECHNARPVAGTSAFRKPFQGGMVDNWFAPNISSDLRGGIGGWTNDQIATFLKTGAAPGKGVALGPMAETIHSLRVLSDADLHAIAAYLKTTPAVAPSEQAAAGYQGAGALGGGAYLSHCASCHGVDGKGLAGVVPALVGNGAVNAQGPQNMIRVVLGGLAAKGEFAPMPAVGVAMSDADIAEVANYVRQLGGNEAPVTAEAETVAGLRAVTPTMLNSGPDAGCPEIGSPQVAHAIADARNGLQRDLAGVTDANMYVQTQRVVAKLRAAAPGVAMAELVNGLTAAYCPVVRQDAKLDVASRTLRLGQFSELVYMNLRSKHDVVAGHR